MTAKSSGAGRPSAQMNCRYFISASLLESGAEEPVLARRPHPFSLSLSLAHAARPFFARYLLLFGTCDLDERGTSKRTPEPRYAQKGPVGAVAPNPASDLAFWGETNLYRERGG